MAAQTDPYMIEKQENQTLPTLVYDFEGSDEILLKKITVASLIIQIKEIAAANIHLQVLRDQITDFGPKEPAEPPKEKTEPAAKKRKLLMPKPKAVSILSS